ncbi:MAG: tyrosine-type recombinase/integrase [Microscillaceae bacterium]|nr:tyrosine-type recombinase/integrase [Microscillaceae bacterium]
MVKSFISYIFYEKRYSPTTISSYKNDLIQFQAFLSECYALENPEKADFNMIRAWLVQLTEQDYNPRSINRKIATLKSYFKFLVKKGVLEINPTLRVKTLKTARKSPTFVEEDKLLQVLNQVQFEDNFQDLRSQLILEILYGTGIRLAELMDLRWPAIDFANKLVKISGKGNKERLIPVHDTLLNLIKKYELIKRHHFEGKLKHDYLIVSDSGGLSYPMLVYKTVKKYLSLVTTQDKKSPHVLRHSFATHLLNKGADLNAIKELLGHSSLNATQVYTHNSLKKLKDVFDQAHPKA